MTSSNTPVFDEVGNIRQQLDSVRRLRELHVKLEAGGKGMIDTISEICAEAVLLADAVHAGHLNRTLGGRDPYAEQVVTDARAGDRVVIWHPVYGAYSGRIESARNTHPTPHAATNWDIGFTHDAASEGTTGTPARWRQSVDGGTVTFYRKPSFETP